MGSDAEAGGIVGDIPVLDVLPVVKHSDKLLQQPGGMFRDLPDSLAACVDVVQVQNVRCHKAAQHFLSEQMRPSVRQPFPEPFHRHHELFGQSHRDGVVVIRFGETRSQRHIGQYDVVARYDVVIDILEAEIHAFPRAEDMDYALGMLHDIEVLIESMKNIQSFSCCSIRFPCLPICGTDVGKKPRNVKIYPPIL